MTPDGGTAQRHADARARIAGEPDDGVDGPVGLLQRLCRVLTVHLVVMGPQ